MIQNLKNNPFVLAPMAGITDSPFRGLMRELGTGIVVTELVSAMGLKYNSEKTRKLMKFTPAQQPVGIQLFGETSEILAEGARLAAATGVNFIDLNFGCPVKKVVKKGAGSAMLRNLPKMAEVLKAVKAAVDIPVTIKIRTGWDNDSRNAVEVARLAYDCGISWVAIHGRTRAAAYSGQADWDYIGEVKAKTSIPVLGNGDLIRAEMAVDRLKAYNLDGVMIGRGCLKNPWIFKQSLQLWNSDGQRFPEYKDFDRVFTSLGCRLTAFYEDRYVLIQLRKFAGWFSAGYPLSASFRKGLFKIDSVDEMLCYIKKYFSDIKGLSPEDTSSEDFLMGGHG